MCFVMIYVNIFYVRINHFIFLFNLLRKKKKSFYFLFILKEMDGFLNNEQNNLKIIISIENDNSV